MTGRGVAVGCGLVLRGSRLERAQFRTYLKKIDEVLADPGIEVIITGVPMPRINAVTQRSVRTCRSESLDRTLIWNQAHLLPTLREFENHDNQHRPHRTPRQAAPLRPVPESVTEQAHIIQLDIRRRDRLGGIVHEYEHAA